MNEVIRTEGLDVGYEKKAVISGVKINALKGQVICLIGPNGAGKSTILRTLSGMLAPINGTVYLGKDDIRDVRSNDLARQMAVVLTERLNVTMTSAYEVAAMGRTPYTGFFGKLSEDDHRIVTESLRTVGALELSDRDYLSLSDGEKQKVMIARALAQEPQLIVLDEPTSHLDIKHKIEVVRILNSLAASRGMTVILALHDVDLAVKSCQFVLLVKDGKIVAQGQPEDVVGESTIGDLYDIEGAMFDSVMGSLEIYNDKAPDAFVASGAGTGTPVFRMLSRMGCGVATGILQANDVDCHIAESMKLTVIAEEPFEPVSEAKLQSAKDLLEKTAFAIDTNFPIGTFNKGNIDLLRSYSSKKPIFSLRPKKEIERLYAGCANVESVASTGDLQEKVAKLKAGHVF